MRLSKAQRAVLERMAAGEKLHWAGGYDPYAFWHDGRGWREPVPWGTFGALERRGLVARPSYAALDGLCTLTPAGRAALGEAGK